MDKDNKYYNYVENLILENDKIAGNEELVEKIIDDVFSKAQVVLNTISDQNVIEEFLSKTASTSVITIIKRHGVKKHSESATNELIKKINSAKQNENVNKKYVDNFINGYNSASSIQSEADDLNLELIDDVINVSDDSNDNSFIIYENSSEHNSDKIDNNSDMNDLSEVNNNDDYNNEQDIVEESLKQFDVKDEIYSDEISELETKLETEETAETIQNIQNEDFPEIDDDMDDIVTFAETSDNDNNDNLNEYDVIETDNDISNENLKLEESDIVDDFEVTDNNEELLVEVDSNALPDAQLNDTNEYVELESFDNQEELLEDNNTEVVLDDNIVSLDNDLIDKVQNLSNYSIFEYVPTVSNNENNIIESNAIIEKLNALDLQEPELKILEIYELKYVQNKSIDAIAETLALDTDKVIFALNKMVDIV